MLNEILLTVNHLKEINTYCGEIYNEYLSFSLYDKSENQVLEITCYNKEMFQRLKAIIKNNFEIEWEDTMTDEEKEKGLILQSQRLKKIKEVNP